MAWQVYMEEAANRPTPTQHYLAQVAQVVAQVLSTNPSKIKLEHYLLKFKTAGPGGAAQPKAITDEELEKKTRASKAYWQALVGTASRKPPRPKGPASHDNHN